MDYRKSHKYVLVAAFLTFLQSALAFGQEPLPATASGPVAVNDPRPNEIAALRQQVAEMQQNLLSQQAQLDQQALQFQQLGAQRPTVPEIQPSAAPLPEMPPTMGTWYPAGPPATADPTPAGTVPPGIVLPSRTMYPWSGSAADPNYPRAVLGGQYRMMFSGANYTYHSVSIGDDQPSQAFINERLRTWLTVQTNDNVEAYVQAQMGNVLWGTNYDLPKTFTAPGTAADQVGIMLRYGYLAYHDDCVGRFQAGIQPWQDSFGQTLFSSDWDFSVGGLSWVRNFPATMGTWCPGGTQMKLGIFELVEADPTLVDQSYLLTLDVDQPISKDSSVGFSAYYLPDRGGYSYPSSVFAPYTSAWDVWIGARFRLGLPNVPINGFAIYNTGMRNDVAGPAFEHNGVALKLEAGPVSIGPGAVSCQALYSTGGNTPGGGFRTVAQSARDNFGEEGYWSYLMLASPQGYSDVNDMGVSLQNRGCGLLTFQTKYDYPICRRLSGTIAAGWMRSDTPNPANGSSDMGTELGNDFTVDFGGGLKADMGASVLFAGDFYKASAAAATPSTLYEAFSRVQLVF